MADFLKTESYESICENIQLGIENKNLNLSNNEQKNTKTIHEQSASLRIQELLQAWQRHVHIFSVDDPKCTKIASELCSLMVKTKSFDALGVFLQSIPDTREYRGDDNIIRARVYIALQKKDTKTVYQLLEEHHFENGEDLIKVWDDALYLDEERRTKKALTPLSRFRARKRCPPPKTICSGGIRKTNTLPREATNHLKAWLMAHVSDPYPSATENAQLAKISGLTQAQVKTWFANARRRNKNTEDFQKRCKPSTDCGALNASPMSPVAASGLSMPHTADNHSSYFMFNNDSMPAFEGGQAIGGGGGTCCDYYPAHLSGYNHRHVCSNEFLADQHAAYSIGANNPRAWRGSEQLYYDSLAAAGRNFMDFAASRSHHHIDYSLHNGYF